VNCYEHDLLKPLADSLDDVLPTPIDTFFFTNSGAEATEAAVKIAKAATKRPNIVVFDGSFHGRTHMTMAMTTSKSLYRAGFAPLPSGVFVAPFAVEDHEVLSAVSAFDRILSTQSSPSETAAVVIELVQGEGGYRRAHPDFVRALAKRCKDHNILFVADEVQSGFGRTGKMFAFEHYGLTPDVCIMAKGIASGFPFAALGASKGLMDTFEVGSHGGTYGGNPMGCAAALATLSVIKDENLLENATLRGVQLRSELESIATQSGYAVSGLGLMLGLVCPSVAVSARIRQVCQENSLLLMTAGSGQVLRFMPPLVVSESEMALATRILRHSVTIVQDEATS
jgi:4-aminobutyrate aminotransferase-like enzyme